MAGLPIIAAACAVAVIGSVLVGAYNRPVGRRNALEAEITVEQELRVVNDGIITSAGISAGIDMAFAVVELLYGQAVADETAHFMEYRGLRVLDCEAV